MKLNLNRSTSNTFKPNNDIPFWFSHLINEFSIEHDISLLRTGNSFLFTQSGAKDLINWMITVGYEVKYWELLSLSLSIDNHSSLGFGLDISDKCGKFVELKLKSYE